MSSASVILGDDPALLLLCLTLGAIVSAYMLFNSESWKLRHIPTAGFSGLPILSYISTIQFMLNGDKLLQQYHAQYKGKPFKVATVHEWIVILHNGVEDIKESMKLSASVANSFDYIVKFFHVKYSFGEAALNHQHFHAMIKRLTHEIVSNIPVLRNEAEATVKEVLVSAGDWTEFGLEGLCEDIVTRVTNRMIVGEKLCRDPAFLSVINRMSKQVYEKTVMMNTLIPAVLWPFTPYFMRGTQRTIDIIRGYLEPIIKQSPSWDGNYDIQKYPTPLDWMIDIAKEYPDQYSVDSIVRRVVQLTFVSLSTTSMVLRITLYNLAAHPKYIPILRDEIEKALSEDGWNRSALDKMSKTESFIQESHRTTPDQTILSGRLMLKDHILREGTFLPRGTAYAHWTDSMNEDEEVFSDARQFDGLRFHNMRLNGRNVGLTQLSPLFLLFGVGRQACPGRFFAAAEIKVLLACILLSFDIKAPQEQVETTGAKRSMFDRSPRGKISLRRRRECE